MGSFDAVALAVISSHSSANARILHISVTGRSGTGITLVLPDEREDITKLADAASLGTELDLAGLRQKKVMPSRNGGRRGGGGARRRRPATA